MTAPADSSDGDKRISDAEAREALKKIGASTSPEAVAAHRTVGRWTVQSGVAEVALATTHQNDDAVSQALISAQSILNINGDDIVKVKAIGSIAQLVRTRIANAELTLKCAESITTARNDAKRPVNRAPQFNVNFNNVPTPDKEAINV